jgi:hypothetical protein
MGSFGDLYCNLNTAFMLIVSQCRTGSRSTNRTDGINAIVNLSFDKFGVSGLINFPFLNGVISAVVAPVTLFIF